MRSRLILSVVLCTVCFVPESSSLAETFGGRVVGVMDGDTIKVLKEGRAEKVRLNRIDCPEKAQAFGTKAKQRTSDLVFGQRVAVSVRGVEKYNRLIGDVALPDARNVSEILVGDGLCWWYRQYAKNDEVMSRLENEAREAKRGLWSDAHPVPPWEFRRNRKKKKRATVAKPGLNEFLAIIQDSFFK